MQKADSRGSKSNDTKSNTEESKSSETRTPMFKKAKTTLTDHSGDAELAYTPNFGLDEIHQKLHVG